MAVLWLYTLLSNPKCVLHEVDRKPTCARGDKILVQRDLGADFPILSAFRKCGDGLSELDLLTDDLIGRKRASAASIPVISALRKSPHAREVRRFATAVKQLYAEDVASRVPPT